METRRAHSPRFHATPGGAVYRQVRPVVTAERRCRPRVACWSASRSTVRRNSFEIRDRARSSRSSARKVSRSAPRSRSPNVVLAEGEWRRAVGDALELHRQDRSTGGGDQVPEHAQSPARGQADRWFDPESDLPPRRGRTQVPRPPVPPSGRPTPAQRLHRRPQQGGGTRRRGRTSEHWPDRGHQGRLRRAARRCVGGRDRSRRARAPHTGARRSPVSMASIKWASA